MDADEVQVVEKTDKSAPPHAGSTAAAAVVREAKANRRKGGKKGRPQSAPSKISRNNPNANANAIPAGTGADTATKPRNNNNSSNSNRKIGKTSRMGSRMREDVSNARSSSTPALKEAANGESGNMSADDPSEKRRHLTKGSTATAAVALGVDSGDNATSSDAKDDQPLQLQMMETRNQELQSRCRHLEQRCAHLEGLIVEQKSRATTKNGNGSYIEKCRYRFVNLSTTICLSLTDHR